MPGAIFRWAAPLFARAARRWGTDDDEDFARRLRPGLPAGGRLLDVGGGTGALAEQLARTVPCRVTIVDASPQMLRYAAGLADVETVLGDAAQLPFADGSFDAALVSDAFHHFVHPERAARELARVVRAGGTIVVAERDPAALGIRLVAVVERLFGEPAGFLCPAAFEALMRGVGVSGAARPGARGTYVYVGVVDDGLRHAPRAEMPGR